MEDQAVSHKNNVSTATGGLPRHLSYSRVGLWKLSVLQPAVNFFLTLERVARHEAHF